MVLCLTTKLGVVVFGFHMGAAVCQKEEEDLQGTVHFSSIRAWYTRIGFGVCVGWKTLRITTTYVDHMQRCCTYSTKPLILHPRTHKVKLFSRSISTSDMRSRQKQTQKHHFKWPICNTHTKKPPDNKPYRWDDLCDPSGLFPLQTIHIS